MSDGVSIPADKPPFTVGIVLYPNFTIVDMAAPQLVLSFDGHTELLWKTLDPVMTDSRFSVNPTMTFADALKRSFDLILVPGGFGTADAINDAEIMDFLAESGRAAGYVTSVCTGSLMLGAVGLLDGYRAATHWSAYDILAATGAVPVQERVVEDRNRFTGGGVTAGLDFGLALLAKLRGEDAAKAVQLIIEYDPKPPFSAGSPAQAGPRITQLVMENGGQKSVDDTMAAVKSTRARFGALQPG